MKSVSKESCLFEIGGALGGANIITTLLFFLGKLLGHIISTENYVNLKIIEQNTFITKSKDVIITSGNVINIITQHMIK